MFLEYIRMPALSNLSTCYKNLRIIGSQNMNVFDSTQGTTGNGILFTCEGGNNATNYLRAAQVRLHWSGATKRSCLIRCFA